MLSLIIPAYNEEDNIFFSYQEIDKTLSKNHIEYEIIYINDGSKDCTWEKIQTCAVTYKNVHGISFTRNFGKESAIMAGLAEARGEVCVVIDCDMQHPVECIIEMYNLWKQGYMIVEGKKIDRGRQNKVYNICAKVFYAAFNKLTDTNISGMSDFKMLDRKVVDLILKMPERNTFFRALSVWCGYKSAVVEFKVKDRQKGKTSWSVFSLIKYTVRNITTFSTAPLQLVTLMGCIFLCIAVYVVGDVFHAYFWGHKVIEGYSTMVCLILMIGSILMISLGLIGYYIARIYEEIKGRPRYIIGERTL